MNVVYAQNLTRKYPIRGGWFQGIQDYDVAVREVDLQVEEGETLGLVGESGSGKSTLAQLLLGLERPDNGKIRLNGDRVDQLGSSGFRPYRKEIQIIFQDPLESFDPRYSVKDCLGEGLINLTDLSSVQREQRIQEMLDQVNLASNILSKYPHQLSGGQRQRVGIARALAVQPDILVLDEPTSALDVSIQAQIINLLLDLKGDIGLTYLFISHDLNLIRYVSDRVAVMKDGCIVERGKAEAVYESPKNEYTQSLLRAARKHRPGSE